MKFMIMMFGDEIDVQAKPPEWAETMSAFMVQLDSELAHEGELVYSEVLEFGSDAVLIDRHGRRHEGSLTGKGSYLYRYWVVTVPDEERAIAIAARIAEVVEAAVEVREVRSESSGSLLP